MPQQQQCKGVTQRLGLLVCDGICQYFIMHLVIVQQTTGCTGLLEGVMCVAFVCSQVCKASGSSDIAEQQSYVVPITLTCINMLDYVR